MVTVPSGQADAPLTVLYDGACPLCRRKVAVYRGLPALSPVCFADVSDLARPMLQRWAARLESQA